MELEWSLWQEAMELTGRMASTPYSKHQSCGRYPTAASDCVCEHVVSACDCVCDCVCEHVCECVCVTVFACCCVSGYESSLPLSLCMYVSMYMYMYAKNQFLCVVVLRSAYMARATSSRFVACN